MARAAALVSAVAIASIAATPAAASAHQSGCHRWHSCPSDSGSYICGDLGYACRYPTYPVPGSGARTSGPSSTPSASTTDFRTRVYLRKLKPGKKSVSVRELQEQLNSEFGLDLPEPLPVTGYYGPMTRQAVRSWQRQIDGARGTAADGILGPKQARKLFPSYMYLIVTH